MDHNKKITKSLSHNTGYGEKKENGEGDSCVSLFLKNLFLFSLENPKHYKAKQQ